MIYNDLKKYFWLVLMHESKSAWFQLAWCILNWKEMEDHAYIEVFEFHRQQQQGSSSPT
jgi:hypothetical protein